MKSHECASSNSGPNSSAAKRFELKLPLESCIRDHCGEISRYCVVLDDRESCSNCAIQTLSIPRPTTPGGTRLALARMGEQLADIGIHDRRPIPTSEDYINVITSLHELKVYIPRMAIDDSNRKTIERIWFPLCVLQKRAHYQLNRSAALSARPAALRVDSVRLSESEDRLDDVWTVEFGDCL
jgi:hypothetical protein